jgi:hypothetical protein
VQLEDTRRAELHHLQSTGLAVVDLTTARVAPGPYDKLTDTVLRVSYPVWGYRGVALVAVVTSARPRPPSEVVEVGSCPFGVVVVVARRGPGAPLVLSSGGLVAVSNLPCCAVGVGVVP